MSVSKKDINGISFSPNPPTPLIKGGEGGLIASAGEDQTIKLWKWNGSKWDETPTTLTGHSGAVKSVSFSADGGIIASGSEDKTIKLCPSDGTPITTLTGHNDTVTSLSFSPDGILASASLDGKVILWNLNLDDLLAQGCQWLQDYFVTHPEDLKTLRVCASRRKIEN